MPNPSVGSIGCDKGGCFHSQSFTVPARRSGMTSLLFQFMGGTVAMAQSWLLWS
jgi:hypothetical protein